MMARTEPPKALRAEAKTVVSITGTEAAPPLRATDTPTACKARFTATAALKARRWAGEARATPSSIPAETRSRIRGTPHSIVGLASASSLLKDLMSLT